MERKLVAQALSLTREQFNTMMGLELIAPIECPKGQVRGMNTYLENVYHQAHKNIDGRCAMPAMALEIDSVKENTSNLIFCRFQHPQTDNSIYMSGEADAKWDVWKHGILSMPDMAVLDFGSGRKIVVSYDDETEMGFSFSKEEILAESESAYKNWKFADATIDVAKPTMIPIVIEDNGQMSFSFDDEIEAGGEKLIVNPTGSERKNICKCSKVISDGTYIYDVKITLYSQEFEKLDYVKDADGNLQKDALTGEYIQVKRIITKPFMDLSVYGYENSIDYTERYKFDANDLNVLSSVMLDGVSLVVDNNNEGTLLHSLMPSYEEEDIEYEKEQMLSLGKDGNGQRIKKGDMKNIITYADLMRFRAEKKLDVV
jgi:hypothetical protein